ncbi:mandelate racemase/muconate lactonizing enzyme family protein [soil metagenome]
MRINDLQTLVLGTSWRNLVYVKLITDEGLVGLGETRLANRTEAVLAQLEAVKHRYVLGADPFEIERLVQAMSLGDQGRVGEVAGSAISAVEIACWDLLGKALGVPVYRLLGGALRDRVKVYANGWYRGERTPEAFAEAARRVVSRGYLGLKLDPFGTIRGTPTKAELAEVVRLCEAVRAAVGPDVEVFIDMHSRFGPADAVRVARALERIEPGWIEEPVAPEDAKGHQIVARSVACPVATGERLYTRAEFRELLERRACDILQPDPTQCGGLLETKKLAATAEIFGMQVAPHNVAGQVATAAILHLAVTLPNLRILETFNDFEANLPLPDGKTGNPVKTAVTGGPEIVDGHFLLPRGPGLGVSIDESILQALPQRAGHFNIFAPEWHRRAALDTSTP